MAKINLIDYSCTKDFLKKIGGEDAIKLVDLCYRKRKNVTDEEIGKKMKHLKITEIRTILNRLHYRGIACYLKTKDKNSGWYYYTWEIRPKRIAELVLEEQTEYISKLEEKLNYEEFHEFFSCKGECESFAFEIAAEYGFKCPHCSKQMDLIDIKKRNKKIKTKINKVKKELEQIEKVI